MINLKKYILKISLAALLAPSFVNFNLQATVEPNIQALRVQLNDNLRELKPDSSDECISSDEILQQIKVNGISSKLSPGWSVRVSSWFRNPSNQELAEKISLFKNFQAFESQIKKDGFLLYSKASWDKFVENVNKYSGLICAEKKAILTDNVKKTEDPVALDIETQHKHGTSSSETLVLEKQIRESLNRMLSYASTKSSQKELSSLQPQLNKDEDYCSYKKLIKDIREKKIMQQYSLSFLGRLFLLIQRKDFFGDELLDRLKELKNLCGSLILNGHEDNLILKKEFNNCLQLLDEYQKQKGKSFYEKRIVKTLAVSLAVFIVALTSYQIGTFWGIDELTIPFNMIGSTLNGAWSFGKNMYNLILPFFSEWNSAEAEQFRDRIFRVFSILTANSGIALFAVGGLSVPFIIGGVRRIGSGIWNGAKWLCVEDKPKEPTTIYVIAQA